MVQNGKENILVAGLICLVTGAFLSVGGIYSMGATIGVGGLVLFVLGMSMKSQRTMSPEEIENWLPAAEQLPDAGRVMYRIDTTLDEPIRSSIVCGPCGSVAVIDGHKPSEYTCSACGTRLWQEEE